VYKTVTDGDELFTMHPNFGAKMVKDKTRQVINNCKGGRIFHHTRFIQIKMVEIGSLVFIKTCF